MAEEYLNVIVHNPMIKLKCLEQLFYCELIMAKLFSVENCRIVENCGPDIDQTVGKT